jgi:hypothetical protein
VSFDEGLAPHVVCPEADASERALSILRSAP